MPSIRNPCCEPAARRALSRRVANALTSPLTCTLGVLSCLFLLIFGENWYNWTMMAVWTVIGFAIYFGYGYKHSKLRATEPGATLQMP